MDIKLSKDMYKSDAPIEEMLAAAYRRIKSDGGCYTCTYCCISLKYLTGTHLCCTSVLGTHRSEIRNNKVVLAKQFIDLFDKPKVHHVDIYD